MNDLYQLSGRQRNRGRSAFRPSRTALLLLCLLPLLVAAAIACGPNADEYEACPVIEYGGVDPNQPPGLPYIFEGTYYVDGDPGPAGVKIWVQMARSLSQPSRTMDDGIFFNVIHGPLYEEDYDHGFVFCIGELDGNSVMASSDRVEYEHKGTFHTVKDIRVDFPRLP